MDQSNQSESPFHTESHPPTLPTHAVRSKHTDPIPPRYTGRMILVWTITLSLVAVLITMQLLSRYSAVSAEVAPQDPAEVGSMQLRISARHGVGVKSLERFLPATPGADPVQQIVEQLGDLAEEQPVQLIRVAGYTHFFRPDEPALAAAHLDAAAAFISGLDEESRDQWEQRGYLEDIADFRTIITEGPEALAPDRRDRLLERYDEAATAALVATLDDQSPERQRFLSKGVRTSATLIIAILIVALAAITGFVLFIVALALLGAGKLRLRYRLSLQPPSGLPEEPSPPPLTLETFTWFLSAFLAVQLIIGILISLVARQFGLPDAAQQVMLLPFLWALLLLALWPVWQGMSTHWNKRALGWHRGQGFLVEIGAGFVGYLAGLPIVAIGFAGTFLMMRLSGMLGLDTDGSHPAPDMIAGGGLVAILSLICLGVMWAPIVEEVFFRGALQHHLRRSHGFIVSALVTGLIFAAIHPQGLVGIPVLTSIGFVFSMLREWRGSLIAPIVAHAINNGFVFGMLIIALA